MIPAKLIPKYDIYERLKTGNFTDEDIDYAFNALFVDSNYGRDNFYSVFLNNEFDWLKCPLCNTNHKDNCLFDITKLRKKGGKEITYDDFITVCMNNYEPSIWV